MAELNRRQKEFVEIYLSNGFKAKEAYIQAYSKAPGTDFSYAWELLHKPEIEEYINERRQQYYDSLCIDANRVMTEIADIAFEPKTNDNKKVKLQALDLLSKNLNLQTVKTENKDTIEVVLVEDE